MYSDIKEWLKCNKDEFPRLSVQYFISIPTLRKVANNEEGRLQKRVKIVLDKIYEKEVLKGKRK